MAKKIDNFLLDHPKFNQFIKQRQYLVGVTDRTLGWHVQALKWLVVENPDRAHLTELVIRMKESGMSSITVNTYARSINAYLHWASNSEQKCSPACQHLRIPRLKEPELILPTFSQEDIRKIMVYKPKNYCQRRLQAITLMMADTGCRITEMLGLKWDDLDFDNLLATINGKGRKQRVIPFSFEMSRFLYRLKQSAESSLVFGTRSRGQQLRCNVLRDVKRLCRHLGITPPRRTLHALRHSFAITYLRRGGSVFHLQKSLGHSDLEMSRKYANLLTDDLQKMHPKVSMLTS
jgi:integrase/recombinase XerD